MRIAIFTSGRFHVCDLARELDALGHEVAFYSYVPRSRTRQFGLPDRCNRCLLPWISPALLVGAAARISGICAAGADHLLLRTLDGIGARLIDRCDVFIGMSGLAVRTAQAVRKKYGAKIWIERGSEHILSQKEIVEAIPNSNGSQQRFPAYAVERELKGYELADTIVIPSLHVERSFTERGIAAAKLFRNPFGVALDMFPPTPMPPKEPPTIIMTGAWSRRKGCDVLLDAWRGMSGVKLLHVGPVLDLPLPDDALFEHHDAVDQRSLNAFYARAHVFALASREEGLALVQAQALASGLRVVCTDRTGGQDLGVLLGAGDLIDVVPTDDAATFRAALARALDRALKTIEEGTRDILGERRELLSWKAYGQRYSKALKERM
ncbi:MAG TPA: glycosyltransferase family 4 protein [Planctomycetota bacterium]|nr:glycosyltransferase family 4 protein [Planctomycetota bacterium]